jgi:hypothetical protein
MTFTRIKLRATVETGLMLLPENEVERAINDLRERLKQLDLAIVSVDSLEPALATTPEPSREDPWSMRGQPVE